MAGKTERRELQRWEPALEKFLTTWRRKRCVIGALLTGSRAFGTESRNSDIDVHILLSADTKWRERGNCVSAGFVIEYFANNLRQLKQYQQEEGADYSRADARMFALGRILFDKTGDLSKLQRQARARLKRGFKPQPAMALEMEKYFLWDELDNLQDLWRERSLQYGFSHKLLLNKTLETYRKFLRVEVSAPAKLLRFMTDKDFRKRYGIPEFKDRRFVRLFVDCLKDEKH